MPCLMPNLYANFVGVLICIEVKVTFFHQNVLHWHIVDSQSFPMQSVTYPKLWDGAYTGQECFTVEDAKDVVE